MYKASRRWCGRGVAGVPGSREFGRLVYAGHAKPPAGANRSTLRGTADMGSTLPATMLPEPSSSGCPCS